MQCILVKCDEFNNLYPLLYNIFFLSRNYVAARSLCSIRSNYQNPAKCLTTKIKYTIAIFRPPASCLRLYYNCANRLNRLQESVSSYNDALRIDPFFVEAFNGRGNALMDFGHDDGTVLGRYVSLWSRQRTGSYLTLANEFVPTV